MNLVNWGEYKLNLLYNNFYLLLGNFIFRVKSDYTKWLQIHSYDTLFSYFFINLVLDCEDNNLYARDEIIRKQKELKIRKEKYKLK
jgi:hypothetical protein